MSNNKYFSDISSNNGSFNASQYASAGYRAIAIKATELDDFVNPNYAPWVRDAHQHGLAVFHYMFCRPEDGDPKGQVEYFWSHVKDFFHRPGDYVVLDVETGSPAPAAEWLKEADAYLRTISGTRPICYAPLSYYSEGRLTVASHNYWIAAWGETRPKLRSGDNLWAWQYNGGVGLGSNVGPLTYAGIPSQPDGSVMSLSLARRLGRRHKK